MLGSFLQDSLSIFTDTSWWFPRIMVSICWRERLDSVHPKGNPLAGCSFGAMTTTALFLSGSPQAAASEAISSASRAKGVVSLRWNPPRAVASGASDWRGRSVPSMLPDVVWLLSNTTRRGETQPELVVKRPSALSTWTAWSSADAPELSTRPPSKAYVGGLVACPSSMPAGDT